MKPQKYNALKSIVTQIRERGAGFVRSKYNADELHSMGLGYLTVKRGCQMHIYIANPASTKGEVNYMRF